MARVLVTAVACDRRRERRDARRGWPSSPARRSSSSRSVHRVRAIFPALEGWGPDKNGETLILLGCYNRNKTQELDIPIGPDNRIEPEGPDYGQPTTSMRAGSTACLRSRCPKDFGNKRLTWTLTANGQTSTVSFWLHPAYWVNFYKHPANGNEPPVIRFARDGPVMTGPSAGIVQTLSTSVGRPVSLTLWASDVPMQERDVEAGACGPRSRHEPGGACLRRGRRRRRSGDRNRQRRAADAASDPRPDITVNWRDHRGPARVSFAQSRIPLVTKGDAKLFLEASTTATFSTPGE